MLPFYMLALAPCIGIVLLGGFVRAARKRAWVPAASFACMGTLFEGAVTLAYLFVFRHFGFEPGSLDRALGPPKSANVGVGFSLYEGTQDVRWLYVGYRCTHCGILGCFAGWKVGYVDSTLVDRV